MSPISLRICKLELTDTLIKLLFVLFVCLFVCLFRASNCSVVIWYQADWGLEQRIFSIATVWTQCRHSNHMQKALVKVWLRIKCCSSFQTNFRGLELSTREPVVPKFKVAKGNFDISSNRHLWMFVRAESFVCLCQKAPKLLHFVKVWLSLPKDTTVNVEIETIIRYTPVSHRNIEKYLCLSNKGRGPHRKKIGQIEVLPAKTRGEVHSKMTEGPLFFKWRY